MPSDEKLAGVFVKPSLEQISPSCVSKWHKLKRETGTLAPGRIGPGAVVACGA